MKDEATQNTFRDLKIVIIPVFKTRSKFISSSPETNSNRGSISAFIKFTSCNIKNI